MEAACFGSLIFMVCLFTVLLEHPDSPLRQAITNPLLRRGIRGVVTGIAVITLIHTRWGKRAGGHLNPSVTLAYFSLGKVGGSDSFFYAISQFTGGVAGVLAARALFGTALSAVHYPVTAPGTRGPLIAFGGEFAISALMMFGVLIVSNTKRVHRLTPLFTGALAAAFLTFEAPLSGASMNPARTFGPALSAGSWTALWVYLTAPPLGMLLAAQLYRAWRGSQMVFCAKLHHENNERCIFRCNFRAIR